MTDADPYALLELEPVGEDRYAVPTPAELPRGDVVYGGQLVAQMIVAAGAREPGKYVKSLSTLFCRTGSYGVIGHTINFHREFDAGTWLLVSQEATFAGKGRIHGRGAVFTEDGTLMATFSQDSMVKAGGRGAGSPL